MTRRLAWMLPCLLLAACKGGGSTAATAPAYLSPGGIYAGTLTSAKQMATYNVIGLIGEDGTLELINTSDNSQSSGNLGLTTSSSQSGTLSVYDTTGAYATQGPLQATVASRGNVSGTYTLATGDSGTLGLVYQARYAVPQSLAAVAGSYKWTSPRNNGTSAITFDNTGAVTGVTETGCSFTGTVSIPNASFDLFSLSLTYGTGSACGKAAGTTLTGLAYYTQGATSPATPATFTAAVTNGTTGLYGIYQRQ